MFPGVNDCRFNLFSYFLLDSICRYETELNHPLRNLLVGELARALLIQVKSCTIFLLLMGSSGKIKSEIEFNTLKSTRLAISSKSSQSVTLWATSDIKDFSIVVNVFHECICDLQAAYLYSDCRSQVHRSLI
jgi:hypothetical protein